MPFLGPIDLKDFLSKNPIITDDTGQNSYSEERIEQAAYALSLGSEAYRTDNKDRKIEILDDKNRNIEINPGQFTLLMTDEYVNIPEDKLAFISIKAKQKLKGLVNVSGFHVDPGFKGKLLFSVYNASPSTITLETKKPYFLIWFANLKSEVNSTDIYNSEKNHHQGQKSIKLEYIDALKRGELASPNALLEKIKENYIDLEKKIDEKNRKVLNNEYLYKTLIGIAIAIFIRYLFVEVQTECYAKQLIQKDSTINKLETRLDTIQNKLLTLHQVDSLIQKKLTKENVKK